MQGPELFGVVWAVVVGVMALAGLVFTIWMLVDAIRVPDDRDYKTGTKLLWVLVILLTNSIGAFIYLFMGRPDRAARPVA